MQVSQLLNYAQLAGSCHLAGFAEVDLSPHQCIRRLRRRLLILAAIAGRDSVPSMPAPGPPALEAKLRAIPTPILTPNSEPGSAIIKQYDCALEAFQSGLKLEPGSAKLYYLVGLTLYASGHPEDAIKPLEQSIYLMPEVLKPHLLWLPRSSNSSVRRKHTPSGKPRCGSITSRSKPSTDSSKSLMAEGDYSAVIELLQDAPRNETLTLDLALAYGTSQNARRSVEVLDQGAAAESIRLCR